MTTKLFKAVITCLKRGGCDPVGKVGLYSVFVTDEFPLRVLTRIAPTLSKAFPSVAFTHNENGGSRISDPMPLDSLKLCDAKRDYISIVDADATVDISYTTGNDTEIYGFLLVADN